MAALLVVLQGLASVMEIVTFIQFIEEEAIQSASLGVFLALRNKHFAGASLAIGLLRGQLLPHLKEVNEYCGWMAPYSKGCFADFILATETNLEIYDGLLYAYAR